MSSCSRLREKTTEEEWSDEGSCIDSYRLLLFVPLNVRRGDRYINETESGSHVTINDLTSNTCILQETETTISNLFNKTDQWRTSVRHWSNLHRRMNSDVSAACLSLSSVGGSFWILWMKVFIASRHPLWLKYDYTRLPLIPALWVILSKMEYGDSCRALRRRMAPNRLSVVSTIFHFFIFRSFGFYFPSLSSLASPPPSHQIPYQRRIQYKCAWGSFLDFNQVLTR